MTKHRKGLNNEEQSSIVFYDHYMLYSADDCAASDFYRFDHAQSSPDPLCIHGADARPQKRNVDRIFLRSSYRPFLWIFIWILRFDLHVRRLFSAAMLSVSTMMMILRSPCF